MGLTSDSAGGVAGWAGDTTAGVSVAIGVPTGGADGATESTSKGYSAGDLVSSVQCQQLNPPWTQMVDMATPNELVC